MLWAVLCSTMIAAQPARIALMVSVVSENVEDEVGAERVLESASARAGWFVGLRVGSPSGAMNVVLDDRARECGADMRCVSAWLDGEGIELLLSIVVNLSSSPGIVTTRLVENRSGRVAGTSIDELPQGTGVLGAVVDRQVAGLLSAAGYVIGGKLAIEVRPADAIVVIEPRANAGTVAAGDYVISASKEGFVATSTQARVRAGRVAQVAIELAPEAESIFASGWFWGAIVTVAVAGVAAGVVVAASGGESRAVLCERREGFTCD